MNQIALRLLCLTSHKQEDNIKTLRIVLLTCAALFMGIVLLFAAIINILTAPFQYAGILGAFQDQYSYLFAGQEAAFCEPLTEIEIEEMIANADTSDQDRLAVLRSALSLVGRVPYFWGGKSTAGWNEKWNTMQVVTAPGTYSSGSLRPYGLDCSGFTDWVWRTAGFQSIGSGVHAQFWASTPINEDELLPGDLVFKNYPDDSVINHVGIYYGKDEETGANLYIHCSSSGGGVIIDSYKGFTLWGRPSFIAVNKEV